MSIELYLIVVGFTVLGIGILYFLKECATSLLRIAGEVHCLRLLVEDERKRAIPR